MIDLYFPNLGNIAHFLGKIRINLRDLRKNIFVIYARKGAGGYGPRVATMGGGHVRR
jgi:hypothetical protein